MIKFSHVYKTYPGPIHALRNLDLTIERGSFLFLTGPSGAGKTTFFRLLSAFDKPTSGSLVISGKDVSQFNLKQVAQYRRQIGVVFQDFKLLKDRTVAENVALPLEIMGEKKEFIQKRVAEVLDQVGLKYKNNSYPEQMSGGEQQRVAIARAYVHKPGLLIADEPTGNLDPDLSLSILKLFEDINAQGTTVIVATHDPQIVEKTRRRTLKLKAGEMEELCFV